MGQLHRCQRAMRLDPRNGCRMATDVVIIRAVSLIADLLYGVLAPRISYS